jgi:hypothetical protein
MAAPGRRGHPHFSSLSPTHGSGASPSGSSSRKSPIAAIANGGGDAIPSKLFLDAEWMPVC